MMATGESGYSHLVLGVDPGTAITGYGVVGENANGVFGPACGVIRTVPATPMHLRLLEIFEDLRGIVREFGRNELP